MTGISFRVTIDDADIRAKLETLLDRMKNSEGYFKNVGEHLLNSIGDNFDNEHGPDGTSWQALSPVTIALRERKGVGPGPILRVSGGLRGSINMIATNEDVRIGTAKVYGAIQHSGGKAGRGRKVTIPARPYLGMSAADQEAVLEIAEDWLAVE